MSSTGKFSFAGLLALLFVSAAGAQINITPQGAFQANPALQQNAINQALINQAVLNQAQLQQAAIQQAAAQQAMGGVAGLPNYLGGGSITSTPLSNPLSYPGTSPAYTGAGSYYP